MSAVHPAKGRADMKTGRPAGAPILECSPGIDRFGRQPVFTITWRIAV
jgi:hypothetical protein